MNRSPVASASSRLTRRTALSTGGAAAAALGVGALGNLRSAEAQGANLADHPLAGTWLAIANPPRPDAPQFPAPSLFAADGTVLLVFPATQAGPQGVVFNAPVMGTWDSDGERRGHFTAVQLLTDASGAFLGSITIDGFPEVSEDGQTFIDDNSRATITFRDAAGAIIDQIVPTGSPTGRPVTAVRMAVGAPGFPEGRSPSASTPAP